MGACFTGTLSSTPSAHILNYTFRNDNDVIYIGLLLWLFQGRGEHTVVFRVYFRLCTQGSLLKGTREPDGKPGIQPRSVVCLAYILFLRPLVLSFFKRKFVLWSWRKSTGHRGLTLTCCPQPVSPAPYLVPPISPEVT